MWAKTRASWTVHVLGVCYALYKCIVLVMMRVVRHSRQGWSSRHYYDSHQSMIGIEVRFLVLKGYSSFCRRWSKVHCAWGSVWGLTAFRSCQPVVINWCNYCISYLSIACTILLHTCCLVRFTGRVWRIGGELVSRTWARIGVNNSEHCSHVLGICIPGYQVPTNLESLPANMVQVSFWWWLIDIHAGLMNCFVTTKRLSKLQRTVRKG